jgi:hypothetical protein
VAAAPVQRFAIVQEIARDGDAPPRRQDEFLDTSFYVVWPRQHLTVTLGSFATGAEWGAFRRDGRGSNYAVALRRRQGAFLNDTAADLETEQRFDRFVLSGAVRGFWPDAPETDNLLWVPAAGVQVYYRGESYVSVRAVRDPRPHTGTTIRIANRWTRGTVSLEAAVAPRSDGVVNSSFAARWGHLLVGYGRERDFDFSRLDRRVFSFGFRYDFMP